ncbi:MAG: bifunctional nuclease family protein [Bacteroidota bacterium]
MERVELNIIALANSESQPNSFVVILKEESGERRLPVVIGGFEAQAIAIAIENIKPNRPLTHDLFKNTLVTLGIDLEEIIISDLKHGIFYATLICRQANGDIVELDSRTSDALALAVRFGCPIYAYEFILSEAGIALEGTSEEPIASTQAVQKEPPLTKFSTEDLEKKLEEALGQENYERAAQIRDELNRRES